METIERILERAYPEFINKNRLNEIMTYQLFHYTNLNAFINIIKTGTLWLTNAEYVNDLLELSTLGKEYNELIINKNKEIVDLINRYKELFDKFILENRERAYIISLSKENDSMAMWRTYGKNGIVLEFDTEKFINYINTESPNIIDKNNKRRSVRASVRIGHVFYDVKMLSNIFDYIQQLSEDNEFKKLKDKDKFVNNIFDVMTNTFFGYYIHRKDKNFSYENEFRITYIIDDIEKGKIEHFRNDDNLLKPYIIIDFSKIGKLPLKSVTINPEMKDIMYEKGIRHFLNTYDYDLEIKYTDNKIRS